MSEELRRLWPRAEQVLDEVFDAPEDEREARARAACGEDPALARLVASLLAADREGSGFLEREPGAGAAEGQALAGDPAPVALPSRVGPFRVTRELGRGGMGTVLLAERDDGQFAQQVAVKLLHAGGCSAPAREALLRERRILGRLVHPHIARLYDGGVTEDGVPYFVMEHVDGRTIDAHCDALQLGLEARLRLFAQVCLAIEYAHGRLVVHRDLKPNNVLVDARGDVKLLDFGIAKLLEDTGENTATAARVFTPVYAAPEQLLGEPITTATDVYQLGLLLYELLTGHRAQGGPSDSVLLLHRRVVEADPERPSRVVRADATAPRGETAVVCAEEIARRRGSSAPALARQLEGDLDAMVLKALRKEPGQRYGTVEALRRDLDAFLGSRPVSARRGTAAYRLRKYARRNRLRLAAAALVAASLGGGLVAARSQARVAARERDRARLAEARAAAVNDFLVNEMLRAPMPEKALGRELTVADVLANASGSVGHAFAAEPGIEAEVRLTLARTYAALGRLPEARQNAEAARRLLAARHGEGAAETLRARGYLAGLAVEEGRYGDARAALDEVRVAQARLLGADHPDAIETTAALGRAVHSLGDWAAAEKTLRGALAALEERDPSRWRLALELRHRLVDSLLAQEKGREAEAICRPLLERLRQQLGPEHPEVAQTLYRLASALQRQLRYHEAVAVYDQVVAIEERLYGREHPAVGDVLASLAAAYENGLQRSDDAARVLERAHAIYRKALGADHPKTLKTREGIGICLGQAGRHGEAEAIAREVLAARRRVLGEPHPDTIRSLVALGKQLLGRGRVPEGRQAARDAMRAYELALAAPRPDPTLMWRYALYLTEVEPEDLRRPQRAFEVAQRAVEITGRKEYRPLVELGNAYDLIGQPDQAIATVREALELPESARSWTSEGVMVDLLRKHRPPQELEQFLLARIQRLRAWRGEDDPMVAKTVRNLALHYQRQGRGPEAERAFREVLAQLQKSHEEGNWEVGRAKSEVGGCVAARGAHAEAEPLLLEGYDAVKARPDRWTREARERLVKLYEAWGRPAEAARWRAATTGP